MTKLYVVSYINGGFAREDAGVTNVAGVYTDVQTARLVRQAIGCSSAKVTPVDLNHVHQGHANFINDVLGVDI